MGSMMTGDRKPPKTAQAADPASLLDAKAQLMKDPKVRAKLKRGVEHYAREEYAEGLALFIDVWDKAPDDLDILTVIATGLTQLGVRDMAIKVIGRALTQSKPTIDLLGLMLNLAMQLDLHEVAVKVAKVMISMNPSNPDYYAILMSEHNILGNYDEAIQVGQAVIPLFPDHADLWNTLGISVKWRDGLKASLTFFENAHRLEPDNVRVLNNMAQALVPYDPARAEVMFRRALEINPNLSEPSMGLAFILFGQGKLEEAHQHYSVRHNSRRAMGHHILWSHGLPEWDGSDLTGKTLMLCGEQGIGDEVMFSCAFPALQKQAGQLVISCEHRLVPIFERSFPGARVAWHSDQVKQGYLIRHIPAVQKEINEGALKIDYAEPFASVNRYFWKSHEDVPAPQEGWLKADPERVDAWRARFAALGDGLRVGICWQSGVQKQGRSQHYFRIDDFARFTDIDGVHFINMQYGDVAEDIARAQSEYGLTVHTYDDVDMKQDIEANLAMAKNLDVIIGPGVATMFFAASVGCRAWWVASRDLWWRFGAETGTVPMSPKGQYFLAGEGDDGWARALDVVKDKLIALRDQSAP